MPTFKHMLFKSYVKRIAPYINPPLEKIFECEICGMPTSKNICAFCRLTKIIKPLPQ
jgi:recombinational DNA repair protein RecR